ncbi:TPA: hypothetical protein N0F65_006683 [Lagenidium giganteum]|uniref:Ubiquitin-like domain-containing protein n=1 Tax=Lagenidium giganteum TaxID=4803 RepID=A0AAV2Z7T4_9STRA|nr:TPA: hypothetical protein N0F65_006683 [Lagenidium giganteum]
MLSDQIVYVDAAPSTPVAEFRKLVERATEMPVHRQRLIYRGKLMKDGAVLSAYNVQDGHTVHLVAKPEASAASTSGGVPGSRAINSAQATSSTTDSPTQRSLPGPRFIHAAGWGDEEYLPNALERNRDRLRRLMNSMDRMERGLESLPEPNLRTPSTLRPLSSLRRQMMQANATEDLGGSPVHGSGLTSTSTPQRDVFPAQMTAEAGLSPPNLVLNAEGEANLEHLNQGILTLRTVLSTVEQLPIDDSRSEFNSEHHEEDERVEVDQHQTVHETIARAPSTPPSNSTRRFRRGQRRFFVGQWLDVKDTVNQWLECTVMEVAEDKIKVHYHGWPSRWDEWIDFDSHRIAAFRTRTVHTLNAQQMSPTPTIRLPNAPAVGDNDIRRLLPQLRDLMHDIMLHVDRLAALCEQEQDPRYGHTEPHATPIPSVHETEMSELAHLVAPLFDRFGRLLTDSARQMDPLLRSELQRTNATNNRSDTANGSLQTPTGRSVASDSPETDTAISMRDLISTSSRLPIDSRPRRSIDVHIHAIVSPSSLSSLASLARAANTAAATAAALSGPGSGLSTASRPQLDEAFGMPSLRPGYQARDGRSIINDIPSLDDNESTDSSRTPLLGTFHRRGEPTTFRRRDDRDPDDLLYTPPSISATAPGQVPQSTGNTEEEIESPSPSRYGYDSIPSPIGSSSHEEVAISGGIGTIPEVAEAEARSRRTSSSSSTSGDDGTRAVVRPRRQSSGFPTFIDVIRRTINGVRNLGTSDRRRDSGIGSSDRQSENAAAEASRTTIAGRPASRPSSASSSSSSSPSSSSLIDRWSRNSGSASQDRACTSDRPNGATNDNLDELD